MVQNKSRLPALSSKQRARLRVLSYVNSIQFKHALGEDLSIFVVNFKLPRNHL